MVDGMIARAAAERRTADDVADLNAALAEFRRATEMEEARRLDRRLHGLVCAAARNPHLSSLSAQLTAAATLGFGAEPYLQEFFDQAVAEHEELIGHVVRGEAHAANSTAQAHFSLTLETMKVRLSQASRRPAADDPPSRGRRRARPACDPDLVR
jgi:DNA-binding GntR family transcriptional regulator